MKVSRLFTIDYEIAEKLKTFSNQSHYVNELLKENLSISSKKSGVIEQKQANLINLKSKMREIRKEIKVFSAFEELKLDNFAIRWLKGHMQEPSHWEMREYIKSRNLEIKTEDFLNAWNLIKHNEHIFEKY